MILALTICILTDPPNLYGVFFADPLFSIFFVKHHQKKDVRWVILTSNIWKRRYSDPSNLDPFSGENHEKYRSVTGFNISLFEGTLHVGKTHVWFKIANTRHALPLPVCRSISPRNGWSFRVYISCYMIPLRDFVPD